MLSRSESMDYKLFEVHALRKNETTFRPGSFFQDEHLTSTIFQNHLQGNMNRIFHE